MAEDPVNVNQGPAAPEIVHRDRATTAVIRGVVPTAELAGFFDRSFQQLGQVLASQGIGMTGPAFGLYHRRPADTTDVEVGFPVAGEVQPEGDVDVGSLPEGPVARVVHAGSFDELGSSWERLAAWIGEQGRTPAEMFWEVYLTEPSPDMDPADLRTELNWSLSS